MYHNNTFVSRTPTITLSLILLVVAGLLAGLYFSLRFEGKWAETDSANMVLASKGIEETGLLYGVEDQFIYLNGYNYQSLVMMLSQLTGIEISAIQQLFLPLLLPLTMLLAYLLLSEISGSKYFGFLGAAIMMTQPELMFVVMRGSHEKIGRPLMLLALLTLFWSLRSRKEPRKFLASILMFYLAIYGYISCNFLLGTSFLAALLFAMLAAMVVRWLNNLSLRQNLKTANNGVLSRLPLASVVAAIFAFLFVFYLFPPAQHDLYQLGSIADQLEGVLLSTSVEQIVDPSYGRVLKVWANPSLFYVVSAANWLVILVSFPIWLYLGYRWLLRGDSPPNVSAWLLWLLYGAFGFQGFLSILVDAGTTYNNTVHRVFPSFSILGVMIITYGLSRYYFDKGMPAFTKFGLAVSILFLVLLSLLKATNEPSLVGWWVFYTQPEEQATQWQTDHIVEQKCWLGPTERLMEANKTVTGVKNDWDVWSLDSVGIRCFFMSDYFRTQAARLGLEIPYLGNKHVVYDNGSSQWFRSRPLTPYQR